MLMPLEKGRPVKVMVAVGIILGIDRRSRQREGPIARNAAPIYRNLIAS
jgi:hypothetical protein